ncbi:MAG: hypothetical protein RLZZ133_410 [Pseudomonadota bacterium]
MQDDLASGQAEPTTPAPAGSDGQAAPRPKRRLKWSNKAGEIIRSNNAHEVSMIEGGTVALSRKAIPQGSESRSIDDDFQSAAEASSGYGRDRFETAARGSKADRFESGGASAGAADRNLAGQGHAGIKDRYAAGQAGSAIRDNYQGGPESRKQAAVEGPSVQREGFEDRTEGGGDAGAVNDRLTGAAAGAAINDRFQGGGDTKPINDRNQGGGGVDAFNDRYQGAGDSEALNDRNQGGGRADAFNDRNQGAGGPQALNDRNQAGQAPAGKASGFVSLEKAIVERGRIALTEEALRRANSGHWGSRKPSRIDELLRKVPKPVFEPVNYFGDVEQIKQRLTGIREQTADIRKGLATGSVAPSSAVPAGSAVSRIRKVQPWQKKSPQ